MRYFFIDFFCGAGGTSLGFSQAGYTVLGGFDLESGVAETYRQIRNWDGTHSRFFNRDLFFEHEGYHGGEGNTVIRDISGLLKERGYKRKVDYLVFGISSPCQPFSRLSGKQVSDERALKRERDSNLLLICLRYIAKFKPDGIFIENVAGIGSSVKNRIPILDIFQSDIENMGYIFNSRSVNAVDFGVPQDRRREIGIAVRDSKLQAMDIPIADPGSRLKTVSAAIGHLPALAAGERSNIPNHIARNLTQINLLRLKALRPGENNLGLRNTRFGDLSLLCHQRLEERAGKQSFADTYTRMHPDLPSPTITTRCNSISNGRFGHYDIKQIRGITPREAAALQSFPDDFIFYPLNETESAARQIGNAVPPALAKFFAIFLKNTMLGVNVVDIEQNVRAREGRILVA